MIFQPYDVLCLVTIILLLIFSTFLAVDKNFSFKKKDILHLVPFFLCALYFTATYYFRGAERKAQIWNSFQDRLPIQAISLKGEQYLRRLLLSMRIDKPFLDPDLTIIKLGRRLAIPPRYLSQVINEFLKVNFHDFVNSYRVEEVKMFLQDGSNGKKSFLEILFEAGFSTNSAFNRTFKKHTGMTPSQYKRRQESWDTQLAPTVREERPHA